MSDKDQDAPLLQTAYTTKSTLAPESPFRVVTPGCTVCGDYVVAAYCSLLPDSPHRDLAWWCPTCQKHIPHYASMDPQGTLWMIIALTQGRPVQWFRKEPGDAPL